MIEMSLAVKKSLLISAVAGLFAAASAQEWPKGIDPSTLLLNTEAEPSLEGDGFIDLFNGQNLDGWQVLGSDMPYHVDNGEIVGTCIPQLRPNSFICTTETYDNFLFTTEFKWDVTGNSGVMFRADARPPNDDGVRRVFGYQAEMDPSPRAWTGGIYGEAMGGWLYPLSREAGHATARAALGELQAWNRLTVYASGNTIRTWINGVPCAYLIDDLRQSGFFGLQVHSGKQGTVRWRNIKVKPLPAEAAWKDLFESGDFSAWSNPDGGAVGQGWTIQEGIVHRSGKQPGSIVTEKSYHDFELRFDWKISHGGNSGVKYRTRQGTGLEYQVLDDANHQNGKTLNRQAAALYDLQRAASDKPIRPVGQWNNARIIAQGNHLQHYLNGQLVLDLQLDSPEWEEALAASKFSQQQDFGQWSGPILLQDHSDEVWYRNLRIRELK